MTLQVARECGVPEREVIRCLPPEKAIELDATNWEQLVRSFEAIGPVRVLISNAVVTVEVVGQFGGFSSFAGFFNVQTPSLDMHIRTQEIDSVFAVEKPSHMDGQLTQSFQFFDRCGRAAFKVFLSFGSPMNAEATALWSAVREVAKRDAHTA